MSFDRLAVAIAEAEAALESARGVLTGREQARADIEARVVEKREQIAALRGRLASQEVSERDAAALAGLYEQDLADLAELVAAADAEVTEAASGVTRAHTALRAAKSAMNRALAKESFTRFHDHVRDLERAYLEGLSELAGLARAAELPHSAVHGFYRVDNAVVRVTQGVVP